MRQTDIETQRHGGPQRTSVLRVTDLLPRERIQIPLRSREKEGLLAELVDLVAGSTGLRAERESIYAAIWDREKVLSTGIGDGVALPHAKYEGVEGVVMAAGVSREPVNFDALDGRPVQLFFLILGPATEAATQVRILSRIGRLLRDQSLRHELVSAEDAERFLQRLGEAERSV